MFVEPNKKEADSLHRLLTQDINDTLRMAAYRDLSIFYFDIDTDSGLYFIEKALPIAQRLQLKLWEADAWDLVGVISSTQGNYVKSLQAFNKALQIAEDPDSEKNIWRIGKFTNSGQPTMARLSMLCTVQSDMVSLFRATENDQEALSNTKLAIQIASEIEDYTVLSQCYRAMGDMYQQTNRLDSALRFYELSLTYSSKAGYHKYSNLSYDEIGNIYLKKKLIKPAMQSYRNSLRSSMEQNNKTGIGSTYILLAQYYHDVGLNDSALHYAKAGLKTHREVGRTPKLITAYTAMVSTYKQMGQPDSALTYLQMATDAKDSMLSLGKIKQLENIRFAEQQRLFEIEAAQKELQSRLRTNILLGSLVTLVVIAFFLYRNNRTKQKAKLKVEAAYDQLKSTQSQLIQSEKMASLGELTAGIAHEIQNPLNFVNNFSEVNAELIEELKAESSKPKAERNDQVMLEILETLKENELKVVQHGKRADAIVKGMLQHSRKSSGQKELTDINALCDEYLRLAYHGLRAKDKSFNAKFETHLDPSLPKINVVPQDIGRVVLNLINNAFYAVSERLKAESEKQDANYEPTVTVSTRSLANKIEIIVKDNGPGIPDSIKDKIFQPFFTTKPTGQGTGLGLSLAYDIVTKAHQGELKVNSAGNSGSEFIISLPY